MTQRWLRRFRRIFWHTPPVVAGVSQLADLGECAVLFPELYDARMPEGFAWDEPEEGERVIGTIRNELSRKLFLVTAFYTRRAGEQALRQSFGAENERQEAQDEQRRASQCADVFKELFWLAAKTELGHWAAGPVTVRKGWRVVQMPPTPDIFRHMFGGRP